jgi:hypothetical protein
LSKLKVRVSLDRAQVFARTRDEVVEGEHAHAVIEKRLAEMRPDEAGPTRNYGSRLADVGITRGRFLDT